MRFLEKLGQEIAAITPTADVPDSQELREDDQVLGEAPLEVKQIFTMLREQAVEMGRLEDEHRRLCGKKEFERRHDEVLELIAAKKRRIEMLRCIMWEAVRDSFPKSVDFDRVSINTGWVVSAGESEDDDTMPMAIFAHIMGG